LRKDIAKFKKTSPKYISPGIFHDISTTRDEPPNIYPIETWLVVFRHHSEKYDFVSWDYEIPNVYG
jgi:hypothetical protein